MYLKRRAYEELTAWKKRPDHSTLEVYGARQVGKTYIVNRFADEIIRLFTNESRRYFEEI